MKRILIALTLLATPAAAQTTTFYTDARGMPAGSADRFGDITFYTDAQGLPAGSATRLGKETFYNGPAGEPAGSSMTFGEGEGE